MVVLLRELVKWSKFGGKQQLKSMLIDNLRKDSEKLVYEYSDGIRSVRDIEQLTNVGKTSVGNYWEKWLILGIVDESKKFQGRMQHICSLGEVGIEVPKPLATPISAPETAGEVKENQTSP